MRLEALQNHYTVGAYPCAPAFGQGSRAEEQNFWAQLRNTPGVAGIEHPALDAIHPYDEAFWLEQIAPHWHIVLTAIMSTMQTRAQQPDFGLASSDAAGRKAALTALKQLFQQADRINQHLQRPAVLAIQIQSAPCAGAFDPHMARQALQASLEEIQTWHWPCPVLLEHCDAHTGRAPQKAFLELEEELKTLAACKDKAGPHFGLCLNWGRLAVEGHSTTYAQTCIEHSVRSGLLEGFLFSGAATKGELGGWQDAHAPFAPFAGAKAGYESSCLNLSAAKATLQSLQQSDLRYLGIKLKTPNPCASVANRMAIIEDGLHALAQAHPKNAGN